jgi:hypothetical protein
MLCGNLRLDGALDLRMDPRRIHVMPAWTLEWNSHKLFVPLPCSFNFSLVFLISPVRRSCLSKVWASLSLRCAFGHSIPGTGWSVLPCSDPRRALKMTGAETFWSFVFCCPFCCCGNLGLSMPAEVGMSSSCWGESCVPGPVSKRMAYLVNVPSHGISCHSIYLSMSLFSRPCPPHFVTIWCILYATSASFMSCLFEGVSIVLHLRSVHIPAGWRGYVQSCYARVEEWTNTFQLDLEVRNIYYQDCKFFFLSVSWS